MEDLSRNNHYVPQMYLSNWMLDEELYEYRLLVSDKRVPIWNKRTSTSQLGWIRDLYTRVIVEKETDELEKAFNRLYETPATEVFNKVFCNCKLTPSDWDILLKFVSAQYVRTPAFLFELFGKLKCIVPSKLNDALSCNMTVYLGGLVYG